MSVKTHLRVVVPLKSFDSTRDCSFSLWSRKLRSISFYTTLVFLLFSGPAVANLLEVKKAIEGTLCKKLATDYAKESSILTVQSIAQLQICLAETLKSKTSSAAPRNFDIQSPQPSTNHVDSMLPTLPTPPTPPSAIKIR